MAKIDELLGPPSIDELLGPENADDTGVKSRGADIPQATKNVQISGIKRYPALAASAATHALAVGLGIPGDLERLGLKGAGYISPSVGAEQPILPSSDDFVDFATKHGLLNRSDLIPGWGSNPTTERYLDAGVEGLTTGALAAATGGEGKLAQIAAGGSGGVAAQGAHDLFPNAPIAPLAAGMAAGLGTLGVKSMLDNPLEAIASSMGSSKTLQEAGTSVQSHANDWLGRVLGPKQTQAWDKVDALVPGDALVPRKHFDKELESITKGAGDATQPLITLLRPNLPERLAKANEGGPKGPIDVRGPGRIPATNNGIAGPADIRQDIETPVQVGSSRSPTYAGPQVTPPDPIVGPTYIAGQPAGTLAPGPQVAGSAGQLPRAPGQGLVDVPNPNVAPRFTNNSPPTWADNRQLLSTLGAAMKEPSIVKDIGQENLKRLYSALSRDLESVAGKNGASQEFNEARAESSRLHSFKEDVIGDLVDGKPLPGDVASKLLNKGKKDGSVLTQLRSEMPGAADELAAVAIRQGHWLKLSPEAQAALVESPATRDAITAASKAAAKPSGSPISTVATNKLLQMIVGAGAGAELLPHPYGYAAGLTLPYIARGGLSLARQPSLLRLPLVGAAAGTNALFPQKPQQ